MRRPWIGGKDFHNFHWEKKQAQGRVMKSLGERSLEEVLFLCYFFKKREEKDDES
jgi:hypothetical protein